MPSITVLYVTPTCCGDENFTAAMTLKFSLTTSAEPMNKLYECYDRVLLASAHSTGRYVEFNNDDDRRQCLRGIGKRSHVPLQDLGFSSRIDP